jgi:hypothetical protein
MDHCLLLFGVIFSTNLPNDMHHLQTIMEGGFLLLPFKVLMQVGVRVQIVDRIPELLALFEAVIACI